jgi:hypothetical protein
MVLNIDLFGDGKIKEALISTEKGKNIFMV